MYNTTTFKSTKALKELIKEFIECLELATEKEPLFIFLDAVDQLLEAENAFHKGLLPNKIPEYVHFVISTSDKSQLALETLKTQPPHSNLIELSPMSRQEGYVLLDKWLKNDGRKLQDEQYNEVLNKFEQEGLPLYLKIIFGEARLWHSYDRVVILGSNIDSVLNNLLIRLSHSSNHGELIVSRSMGYLTAAKNGLTEDEMLDILSNDLELYEDFIKTMFHVPVDLLSCAKKHLNNKGVNDTELEVWFMDMRNDHKQLQDFISLVFREKKGPHLPMILWIRLYHDLEPYLTEHADNDTSLLNFYHPMIGKAISALVGKRHRDLADYFVNLQNWVNKEKRTKPNIRKMAELPYQQTYAEMWKELEKTICDLDFVEAKCSAGMAYDLVSDYTLLGIGRTQPGLPFQTAWLWKSNFRVQCIFCLTWHLVKEEELGQMVRCPGCNREMKLNEFVTEGEWHSSNLQGKVEKTVRKKQPEFPQSMLEFSDFVFSQAHLLSEYPQITFQQAANYPDKTAPAQAAKNSQKLGEESFSWFEIVNKPQQIGQDIMTLRGHQDDVVRCGFSPDGKLIVSASRDATLRVWDSLTGRELSMLEGHSKDVVDFVYLPMVDRIVSASWDSTLRLWNSVTGELLNTLVGHGKEVFTVAYSPEGKLIASGSLDNTVRLWNVQTGKKVGVLYGHNKSVVCCCFSPQGDRVVTGSWDNTLKLWKVIAGEENKELATLDKHKDRVRACDFSPDGTMLVSASADKTLILWDAHTGKKLKILEGHTERVNVCKFSPNGKYVVSVADDHIVQLWPIHSHSKNSINLGKGNSNTVSFSPDGKYISDGFKVWLVDNVDEVIQLTGHHGHVKDCAWSPDGCRLVSASRDGTLIVWDVYFQANIRKIKDSQTSDPIFRKWTRKKQPTVEHPHQTIWHQKYLGFLSSTPKITIEPMSDRFIPDVLGKGEWCKDEESIVYATEGAVLVMDTFLSGQIAAFPWYLENRHLCSCSPDGKRYVKPCREGLFDLQTGTKVCHLPAWKAGEQAPGKEYELITFSPDGTRLARYVINANHEKPPMFVLTTSDKLSAYDKLNNWRDAVLLWNVQTGNGLGLVRKGVESLLLYVLNEEKKIEKHKQWGRINALEFSPDGQFLLTIKDGDTESELRLWNLQTSTM
jgi:WD40 repeat protein